MMRWCSPRCVLLSLGLLAVTSCASAAGSKPVPLGPSSISRDVQTAGYLRERVYVTDADDYYGCGCVDITDGDLSYISAIYGFYPYPTGITVDSKAHVYVAGSNYDNEIRGFRRDGSGPFRVILTAGGGKALAAGPDGTLYQADTGYDPPGVIEEIAPGATAPTFEIKDEGMASITALTVSDASVLYVAYEDASGKRHVKRFTPGSSTGESLSLRTNGLYGIALDADGNIVTSGNDELDVFDPRSNQTGPIRVIKPVTEPGMLAFDASGRHVYVVGFIGSGSAVTKYNYATGAVEGTFEQAFPFLDQVAVSPPLF